MIGPATPSGTTEDAFLGGKVAALQPARGHHRSGMEAVLLAAALDSATSGSVVDLGAGAGVAGYCVAARCPAAEVVLVERDSELVEFANSALKLNQNGQFADRVKVVELDLGAPESTRLAVGLKQGVSVAVVTNPPFHAALSVSPSPARGRARAHIRSIELDSWFRVATWLLRPDGVVVIVMTASALPELLASLAGRFGAIDILPLHPRPGTAASRLIVRAVKGSRAALSLLPGLVVHNDKGPGFTAPLETILRHGAGLEDVHPSWRKG